MWLSSFYMQVLLLVSPALALLEEPLVAFEHINGALQLQDATIIHHREDPVGVGIAIRSLADDFKQITGQKLATLTWGEDAGNSSSAGALNTNGTLGTNVAIIIGTVDSPLIRRFERSEKLEVDDIRGSWESFRTAVVEDPVPGVARAFVITGSDMRGTMFGIYTLTEQCGKSPLHWWADVPPMKHERIYALDKITTFGEPSVKFRGIFINDEAPSLTSWWAKHTGKANSDFDGFGADFYEHVFDLLVRLRANFIWPAMWSSFFPAPGRMFFTDDPRNQQLADDYGIVVSTSHHEPMQRASNEWKVVGEGPWNWVTNKDHVVEFMDNGVRRASQNDSYFTLGMRGENDGPIEADDPIAVLEDVFSTQRNILAQHYGNETAVKQIWTIYKEVATYYAAGLSPPEDVTLMFTDDNWGNVQRLPNEAERNRSGGIGLYHHFSYVGRPKSWKWQNSVNYPKAYKELFQAYERGADRVWVINVGDIKPVEVPLNMAMSLAWNTSLFDFDTLPTYLEALVSRDFGSSLAGKIASALMTYSHLVGIRQFELTEPTTYSVVNFEEADRVLQTWKDLADAAQDIYTRLPSDRRDALYHVLTYPAVAGYNYHKIVIGQAKNRQFSYERRNSANVVAQQLIEGFDYDMDLVDEYDGLANGKWKGIMSTPKFDMNVADWRPSSRDVMANLSFVQLRQDFDYGFGNLGIYVEQSQSAYLQGRICASINPSLPTKEGFSPVMRPMEPHGPASRFIELFHRGDNRKTIQWSIEVPYPWIKLSRTSGAVSKEESDQRVLVSIDWNSVPRGFNETVTIRISWDPEPYFDLVHLPVHKVEIPQDFVGFPETDGLIAIEAPHYQRISSDRDSPVAFTIMPRLGSRSESGSVALRPYSSAKGSTDESKLSWAEYDIYIFGESSRNKVNATVYINGALDTDPESPMEFALYVTSLGDSAVSFYRVLGNPTKPGDTPPEWNAEVANHVWTKTIGLGNLTPGKHTLRWQVNSPEVYLEKIVVATKGRLPQSHLGSPETTLISGGDSQ